MGVRRYLGLLWVLTLAACGGGGGGGVDESSVSGDTPTFRFNARYPMEGWGSLAQETLLVGGRVLGYAQFTTDLVHRFARAEGTAAVTANCAYSGRITMQMADLDGNGRASAGDSITAVLDRCGVPVLGRALTGTVRVEVVGASSQGVGVEHQARLVIVDALRLEAIVGGPNIPDVMPGVLRGSLGSQWSESSTGMALRAASTAADDLSFTATYDGIESVDRIRRIDISRATRYDLATGSGGVAFMYDVGARGGVLRVRTPVAIEGDLDVAPRQMQVDITMGDDRVLRLQAGRNNVGPWVFKGIGAANGALNLSSGQLWPDEAMRFTADARKSPWGGASYTDRGFALRVVSSWRDSSLGSDIDRACLQSTPNEGWFKADALFQRPVLPPVALSEADGVLQLQFGRAIAQNTPALQFRFAESIGTFDPRYPAWHVAATAVRRGASFEIRPTEPLRKGWVYQLEASTNGADWASPKTFLDDQGVVVTSAGPSFGSFYTDRTLMLAFDFRDTGTVSAQAPQRLQSRVTLAVGQTAARYQWRQLSGLPVTLSSPQAANTDVLIGPEPREVEDVVLQLEVTDSRGLTDRARVVATVGNRASSGAALYRETGGVAGDFRREATRGSGSVFYGPEPGLVSPRVVGPTEGGTGVSFSLRPADGGRLSLGSYPAATLDLASLTHPGLVSRIFCGGLGAATTGSFEVLDVAYAADGTITRLAVDYEQRCGSNGAYDRSSYRLNSLVLLRP